MLLHGRLLLDPTRPPVPGWLLIDGGRIADLGHADAGTAPPPAKAGVPGPVLGDDDLLIAPGFVDAHMHLPQIGCVGCDGLELLPWLDRVIFPAETAWSDPAVVRRDIATALARLRAVGTVGTAAFASPIASAMETALQTLGDQLPESAIRVVVGQALMDRNGPDALTREPVWTPPTEHADLSPVTCSVNPRFAVSCGDAMLAAAADLARRLGDPIVHTHLAESVAECETVGKLFPDDRSYTAVYDRHGLLGPRTVLAHAIHLDADDWRTIAARGATVVHCPQANLFLRSGLFDLGAARAHGVRVALGSDIAAGCDLAMPRVARSMIEVAKVRAMCVDPASPIPTPAEAWRTITEVNAEALGWPDLGRLAVGASGNVLALRTPWSLDDPHLVGRLIHGWESVRMLNGRIGPGVGGYRGVEQRDGDSGD